MLRRSFVAAILALALIAFPRVLVAQEQSFDDVTKPFKQWNGKLRFPKDELEPEDPSYWLISNRYASYILDGLNEPALFDQVVPEDTRIIRLTILPSFQLL